MSMIAQVLRPQKKRKRNKTVHKICDELDNIRISGEDPLKKLRIAFIRSYHFLTDRNNHLA